MIHFYRISPLRRCLHKVWTAKRENRCDGWICFFLCMTGVVRAFFPTTSSPAYSVYTQHSHPHSQTPMRTLSDSHPPSRRIRSHRSRPGALTADLVAVLHISYSFLTRTQASNSRDKQNKSTQVPAGVKVEGKTRSRAARGGRGRGSVETTRDLTS